MQCFVSLLPGIFLLLYVECHASLQIHIFMVSFQKVLFCRRSFVHADVIVSTIFTCARPKLLVLIFIGCGPYTRQAYDSLHSDCSANKCSYWLSTINAIAVTDWFFLHGLVPSCSNSWELISMRVCVLHIVKLFFLSFRTQKCGPYSSKYGMCVDKMVLNNGKLSNIKWRSKVSWTVEKQLRKQDSALLASATKLKKNLINECLLSRKAALMKDAG